MPVADLIKDIESKKLKAVQDRLKKEKTAQKYTDAKKPGVFFTPLHCAVRVGEVPIIDALLAAAADVNAVDHEDNTPLHWVAKNTTADVVKIAESLLKKKAKPDAVNKAKLTPLHLAVQAGNTAIIPVLAKGEAVLENNAPGFTPLVAAVTEGKQEAVDALIAAGSKLGAQDSSGKTCLMLLLEKGDVAAATALLEKGDCNVNAQELSSGRTALLSAVCSPSPDLPLIQALLAQGAGADVADKATGDTPAMLAIRAGQEELAGLLIKASQKINAKNSKGETALSLAVASGRDALVEAVLAAGADVSADGVKMMKGAMEGKKDGLAAQLVSLLPPSQLQVLDLDFKTLASQGLGQAAAAYLQRFQPELLPEGKQAVDDAGNSQLHRVSETSVSYDVVAALLRLGLGPNLQNKEGDTPLHVAARAGHVEVCRALVDGGSDPLRRNNKNRTPGSQLKLPEATKDYLRGAEEEAKERKADRNQALFGSKIAATQTESAFGLRCV